MLNLFAVNRTNRSCIIRDISFFDDDFKESYPHILIKKSDNLDTDKEISDSHALKPVLSDFFAKHPTMSFSTFLAKAIHELKLFKSVRKLIKKAS